VAAVFTVHTFADFLQIAYSKGQDAL
jgi:hypothetical protein